MEYKFVSDETGDRLEENVNKLMRAGWVPLGGVAVAVLATSQENERKGYTEHLVEWSYSQAMTRTDEAADAARHRNIYD